MNKIVVGTDGSQYATTAMCWAPREAAHDSAGRALIERVGDAGLVVAGTRVLGRVGGTLLGSVSRQLLHHAPCPVVVI